MMGVAGAPYRLADPLSKLAGHYAAIVIDTRPSFSLMTEMALVAATDALIPVEPRYLETVGLLSVLSKINDIREGWRRPDLRVGGILVTKMDTRVRGHVHYRLDENQLIQRLGEFFRHYATPYQNVDVDRNAQEGWSIQPNGCGR